MNYSETELNLSKLIPWRRETHPINYFQGEKQVSVKIIHPRDKSDIAEIVCAACQLKQFCKTSAYDPTDRQLILDGDYVGGDWTITYNPKTQRHELKTRRGTQESLCQTS